jgi:O-antigen ligase
LWAIDPQIALRQLPTLCAFLILYLASGCVQVNEREIRWTVGLSVVGALAASAVTVYQFYQGHFYADVTGRASLIIGNREASPNALALGLLFPVAMTVVAFTNATRRSYKLGLLAAVSLLVFALFLTMSRGGLFSLAIMLVILLYRYGRDWRRLFPVLATLALPVLAMPSTFFQRLQQSSATGGAGRVDIWQGGFEVLKHYAGLGAGLANFPVAYTEFAGYSPRFMGYQRDAHNVFLAVASELGVIGLLLFLAAIVSEFRAAARARQSSRYSSSMLMGCEAACGATLVSSLFLNSLFYKAFWFSWIMLILMSQVKRTSGVHLGDSGSTRACNPATIPVEL